VNPALFAVGGERCDRSESDAAANESDRDASTSDAEAGAGANERIEPPTFDPDEVPVVDDDHFAAENVAVVTGAGSGIGRATALACAANGLTVAATDVDGEGLNGTAERAAEHDLPGPVVTAEADLTDDAELEGIVETAADHGDVRYLANVAGLQHIDPIESFPMVRYDLMHDVMLRAPLYLSKLVVPRVRDTTTASASSATWRRSTATTSPATRWATTSRSSGSGDSRSPSPPRETAPLRSFSVSTAT
jgi:hypothetical protein